jgi:hypothetical protein
MHFNGWTTDVRLSAVGIVGIVLIIIGWMIFSIAPTKNRKTIGCRGHSGLAGSVAFYYGEL